MFATIRKEMNRPGRIYGLDAMRAVAALLIVYLHGNTILEKFSPTLACIPIVDGVDLFFALSGFLIGGIILKEIAKPDFKTGTFLKKFWIRRWFRTLPNYYLFLILDIILIYIGVVREGMLNKYLVYFFTFLQNFSKPIDYLFWESWSLSVEEWFYFLFPLLFVLLITIFRRRPQACYLIGALTFIVFSTGARFIREPFPQFDFEQWDLWVRKLVIYRLDSIGYGLLAAWICQAYYRAWRRSATVLFIIGLCILVGLLQLGLNYNAYFSQTWYFTLSGVASAFLLPLAEQSRSANGRIGRAFVFVSVISYSMYLCNRCVVAAVITQHFNYAAHPVLFYLVYWFFVLVISSLAYAFFEKPVMQLRERFT